MDSIIWFLVPISVAFFGLVVWFVYARLSDSEKSAEKPPDLRSKGS